jgi:murein DD-endopeptidase MepM/ murein hydrolase activator NlpD
MRKVITSLAPLKKIRPSKKVLLVAGYLLVVCLMIVAVTWRGISADPVEIAPNQPGTIDAGTEDQPVTRPDPPYNALDEEDVVEGVLPEENTQPALAAPDSPMRWPLEGQVLFGHHQMYRIGNQLRAHVGVDLEAPAKMEVRAAWPGVVERVTKDTHLGWLLEIRHGGGYLTQYANLLEEPFVAVGDEVQSGHLLGQVGESAVIDATEGTYLHFAVYHDNIAVDPVTVISPR